MQASRTSLEETAQARRTAQDAARAQGRDIGCYTVGVVTCRPTKKEAEEYFHHCIVEHADWSAVDVILALRKISPETVAMEKFLMHRSQYAQGNGGLPIVGDPDHVAAQLADLARQASPASPSRWSIIYDELPYFCRRGDRAAGAHGAKGEGAQLTRNNHRLLTIGVPRFLL